MARNSKWSVVRKLHKAQNPYCAACLGLKIDVHHVKPVHVFPWLELDLGNLISLCHKHCHLILGHLGNWKLWNPRVRQVARVLHKVKEMQI